MGQLQKWDQLGLEQRNGTHEKLDQLGLDLELQNMMGLSLSWACELRMHLGLRVRYILGCRDPCRRNQQRRPNVLATVVAWPSNPAVFREGPSNVPWYGPLSCSARMSGVLSWSQSLMRGQLELKLQSPTEEFHG